MALTMNDPVALRRYIDRTRDLLRITPGRHAQALLRQMIDDAERQAAKRNLPGLDSDTGRTARDDGVAAEAPPLPLGGTAIKLHLMTDAQLNAGIRDAGDLAAQLMQTQVDAAFLLLAGIDLAISELVTRSARAEQVSPRLQVDEDT